MIIILAENMTVWVYVCIYKGYCIHCEDSFSFVSQMVINYHGEPGIFCVCSAFLCKQSYRPQSCMGGKK